MQTIGSRQASNSFGSVLNTIQTGETVTITRNDRETAVMISPIDFKLLGGERLLLERRSKYLKKQQQELMKSFDVMQEEAENNGIDQKIIDNIIGNE